ncbi:MAG: hypothetical protein KAX49_15085 [Halanaerobiales bacterium]|nr:hypothetical protein [Halanaerobiales bacterium]
MYRQESFQRVYAHIHELRKMKKSSSDIYSKMEFSIRIQNLKNIIGIAMINH